MLFGTPAVTDLTGANKPALRTHTVGCALDGLRVWLASPLASCPANDLSACDRSGARTSRSEGMNLPGYCAGLETAPARLVAHHATTPRRTPQRRPPIAQHRAPKPRGHHTPVQRAPSHTPSSEAAPRGGHTPHNNPTNKPPPTNPTTEITPKYTRPHHSRILVNDQG